MQRELTADEMDASMLGVRLPSDPPACVKALKASELLLHVVAWVGVAAAIVLDDHADGFDMDTVLGELRHYRWRTTTLDAVLVTLLAAAIASVASLNRRPVLGLAASVSACGACVAKRAMLLADAHSYRAACATVAVAATCCLVAATLVQALRARRAAALNGRLVDDVESSSATRRFDDALLDSSDHIYTHGGKKGASFGRLLRLATPERCMLAIATVALFCSTAAQMALPAVVGHLLTVIIGSGTGASHYATLGRVTLQLIAIFAIGAFFAFWRGYLFTLAGERVVARLRKALFSHLLNLDIGFFDESKTGELLNRLSSDTSVLQDAVTINVSMGLRFAAQVIICIVAVFWIQWRLTLVMLSIVPVVVGAAIVYGRFIKKVGKAYQQMLADASTVAHEKLSSVRTVRSFAMERDEVGKYAAAVSKAYKQGAKRALGYGFFISMIMLVGQSAVIVVLWYGGTLVLQSAEHQAAHPDDHSHPGFNAGNLMAFLLYTVNLAAALGGLAGLFSSMMNAVGASDRIFQLFDRAAAIANVGGEVLPTFRGELQLKDVTFAYPTRPDVLVLDHVSLTIKPGTITALCGHSGSGKSSIIGLIERFYDPLSGALLVDGMPLTQLDVSWWRKQAALVAQEPVLFACSISDNILYGSSVTDHSAVVSAALTANAHTFVSNFPDGYSTLVGERGVQLSGGQKQRIAIARAVLADPRMLLLDEATSALDAESEHIVQEAIDRLMINRTTVIVAHRLSTISGADTICVVNQGTIAEQGSHTELLAMGGIYKQLVSRQLAGSRSRDGSSVNLSAAGEADGDAATAPTS